MMIKTRAIHRWVIGALTGVALAQALPALAATPADLCDRAAAHAAQTRGVPLDVLLAIGLTETGRRTRDGFRPWPWTVNLEGRGHWFASPAEALDFLAKATKDRRRSFDVGCFQINNRWHGAAFASVEAMFDPIANADYAARFLSELYLEFGDWSKAAGAYHSRTPTLSRKYRSRFDRIRANLTPWNGPTTPPLDDDPAQLVAVAEAPRPPVPNPFPLLIPAGAPISAGSLVPLSGARPARAILPAG